VKRQIQKNKDLLEVTVDTVNQVLEELIEYRTLFQLITDQLKQQEDMIDLITKELSGDLEPSQAEHQTEKVLH